MSVYLSDPASATSPDPSAYHRPPRAVGSRTIPPHVRRCLAGVSLAPRRAVPRPGDKLRGQAEPPPPTRGSTGPMSFDMAARIEAWRTLLLDTTRRNRLINFKTGRGGGILLVHPDPGDLWDRLLGGAVLRFARRRDLLDLPEPPPDTDDSLTLPIDAEGTPETPGAADELKRCLESPRLRDADLLTDLPDDRLRQRLTRLALGARESLSEQGVVTLYVCFGFLRWFESPD